MFSRIQQLNSVTYITILAITVAERKATRKQPLRRKLLILQARIRFLQNRALRLTGIVQHLHET